MMQFAVTSEGMKQIERKAFESGIPYLTMMENAGKSAAEEIINRFPDEKSVAVLCGKGNNAGDGFVVARLLKKAGFSVSLFLLSGTPVTDNALENYNRCLKMDIPVSSFDANTFHPEIIVDAVYGAGFQGNLPEDVRPIFQAVNQLSAHKVALDLPSGLGADLGLADIDAFRADLTVTFARYKKGQFTPAGQKLCGEILLKDIGI